jgi:O-antigen/teichoic acid export membrane protein
MAVKAAGAATAFVAQVILARLLSVSQYGIYTFVMAWITLIALLAPLGADKASLRFIPAYLAQSRMRDVQRYLRWAFGQCLIVSICLSIITLVGVFTLRGYLPAEASVPFLFAAAIIPINGVVQIATEIVRAFRMVVASELPNMVFRPIVVGGVAWIAMVVWDVPATASMVVLINGAAGVMAILLLWLFINSAGGDPDPVSTPQESNLPELSAGRRVWIRGSLALLVVVVSNFILGRTDILMLGVLVGPEEAALYNAASRIATSAGFPLIAIASILTPMISRSYSSGRDEELQAVLTFGAWLSLAASVVVGATVALMAEPFLGLFGPDYRSEGMTLRILVIGQVVSSLAGAVGYLLAVTGRQQFLAFMTATAAVFNIGLNALLIPPLGATGAAIATAVTLGIYNLVLAAVAIRKAGLNPTIFAKRYWA